MVKVGLIGVGYWGRNHLRSFKQLQDEGELDDIVVCETNKHSLLEVKKYDGVEIQKDWKKLVKDKDLDMVSIVTPTPFHYNMSKEFLLAGKDVLVEKPMAMNVEECDDLIETIEKTGSGLMVGHIFRFHTGVLEIKNKIEKGDLGDILYINIRRQTLTKPRKDMGVMLALGIHEVDLACFLLGDKTPETIFADMNYYYDKYEEMAFIIQKFGNTTSYSFESWVDPSKGKLREMSIIGSQGSASLDFSVPNRIIMHKAYMNVRSIDKQKQFDLVDGGDFEISFEFKEPLHEELKHFIQESNNEKKYLADSKIGRRAVLMVQKAVESNKQKKFVEVK